MQRNVCGVTKHMCLYINKNEYVCKYPFTSLYEQVISMEEHILMGEVAFPDTT